MTLVNKHLVDELHAEGWHLVTTREWYEMQARIAVLESERDDYKAAIGQALAEEDDAQTLVDALSKWEAVQQ